MSKLPKVSIAPKTHLLMQQFHQNHSWLVVLCEAIDNSLNAGATWVRVQFGPMLNERPRFVRVIDNGRGADAGRIEYEVYFRSHLDATSFEFDRTDPQPFVDW